MPRRPISHRLETKARDQLKKIFHDIGWTCEDLHQDYGEDLLVRIFKDERATPLSFFVQSKGTSDIEKLRKNEFCFRCDNITCEHIRHWSSFREPVFLTIYDEKTELTYWEHIQYFTTSDMGKKRLNQNTKKSRTSVDIPMGNLLCKEGIDRIHNLTQNQYRMLSSAQHGAEILIELLEEHAGIIVDDYSIGDESIHYKKEGEEATRIIVFGKMSELLNICEKLGADIGQIFTAEHINNCMKNYDDMDLCTLQYQYQFRKDFESINIEEEIKRFSSWFNDSKANILE
jgi:Domain of unknown function (DUF4365)